MFLTTLPITRNRAIQPLVSQTSCSTPATRIPSGAGGAGAARRPPAGASGPGHRPGRPRTGGRGGGARRPPARAWGRVRRGAGGMQLSRKTKKPDGRPAALSFPSAAKLRWMPVGKTWWSRSVARPSPASLGQPARRPARPGRSPADVQKAPAKTTAVPKRMYTDII